MNLPNDLRNYRPSEDAFRIFDDNELAFLAAAIIFGLGLIAVLNP